jgi:hypothetical protein
MFSDLTAKQIKRIKYILMNEDGAAINEEMEKLVLGE